MRHNLKYQWQHLNVLYKLLVANVAVFLIIVVIELFAYLFRIFYVLDIIIRLFALPAAPLKLLLKPWTLFTYMFLHVNFWHIFGNLLWLYFMGIIFLMYFSEKQLWRVYVISGLAGAALYFLSYNIFPVFWPVKNQSILLGASAAVSGIVLAVSAYKPNDYVYVFGIFKVPLWLIGALYVLYDLSMLPLDNAGGHIAHLGGALYGLWFGLKFKKGQDVSLWLSKFNFKSSKSHRKKYRVVKNDFRPQDYQWNAQKQDIKKEIDRILDKISKHGYNSLTKKEREFLRQHSKDYDGFTQ